MEVRLLGPVEARRNGTPVPLGARMERALLTILLLEAGRVVPADRLVDLLWDGRPPPKASAALHTKVAHLRRALEPGRAPRGGDSVIATAPPGYRLVPDALELDSDRFESLLAEATRSAGTDERRTVRLVGEALALWRGPALGEFAGERFARPAAERLEGLRAGAAELRATALLALGDVGRAVAELQPHVMAHPLREQARASLARALYLSGRQADALTVLADGRRLLRDELGLDPSPELRDLERRILEHDPGLSPPVPDAAAPAGPAMPVGSPPTGEELHGRRAERAVLNRAVAEAAAGRGSVVLVTGDAGIGKTALLDDLRRAVVAAGGRARTAVCRDGVAAPPFLPVLQVVRDAAPDLAAPERERLGRVLGPLREMVPGLGADGPTPAAGVDPAMVMLHLTDALQLTLEAPPGLPALAVFDDVHEADPATLQLITGLAAAVHRTPVLLALSMRSGEGAGYAPLTAALGALGRAPRLLRLDLEPLTTATVRDLVRAATTGELGDDVLDDVVHRADGNPFFALELARVAVAERGPTGPTPPERGRAVGGVPAAVLDVLRQRFLALPDGGTELLTAVAVAGQVSAAELAVLTGEPVERTLALLDSAIATRLAVDLGDGRIALPHSLLGDALRASTSSARLAHLHRAFAGQLAARVGGDPEQASRIAGHHLAARALDGGLAALPWLGRASDHAVRVSALDQLRSINEQIVGLLAAAPPPPEGSPDVHARYRQELRARGRIAYADAWSGGFDSPTIREFCRLVRMWEVPEPAEPDDLEILWLATLFFGQLGRLDDADDAVARMSALAAAVDDATATFLQHDMSAVVRWMQGRFRDALAHLDRAEESTSGGRLDLRRSLAFSPPTRIAIIRAHCMWHLGDRAAAFEQLDVALAAAGAAGLGAAGFARRWALMLALMDGDATRVRALVSMQVSDPVWERFRYPSSVVRFAEGWLRSRDGDPRGGLPVMREAHAALVEQGLVAARSVLLGLLAEATLAAGDPAQAAALCDAGLAVAELGERFWVPQLQRVAAAAAAAGPAGISGRQATRQSGNPG
jgi:DNA-binding SARP family transcriptional activator